MSSSAKQAEPTAPALDPAKLQKAARTEFRRAVRLTATTFPLPGADLSVLNPKGPLLQKVWKRLNETHKQGGYKKAFPAAVQEVMLAELPVLGEKQPNLCERFAAWSKSRDQVLKDKAYEAQLAKQVSADELRRQERLQQAAKCDEAKKQQLERLAKLQAEKEARDYEHDTTMAELEVELSFSSNFLHFFQKSLSHPQLRPTCQP